jgi:hypothetical protein
MNILGYGDRAGNFLTEPKYVKKQKGNRHFQVMVGNYISKQSMIRYMYDTKEGY